MTAAAQLPTVLTVVGNRPQFIKLGVTARALRDLGPAAPFRSVVVNTGQHYDTLLSDVFFQELQIEAPDYNLGVGSGAIVDQVGKMLPLLREIIEREAPDAVLVYGDTNSTLAAAIVAAHHNVPLIHVEGGERLYRRAAMPEEVNRVATDHLADLCLCSSRKALAYLAREGFGPERARFVGDPMYDLFKLTGELLQARPAAQPAQLDLVPGAYVMATLHRAENTDSLEAGIGLMEALDGAPMPVLLPAHPRLTARLDAWGWAPSGALRLIPPLGYFDFQSLLRQSALVVTDSGGVGREALFAGKGAIVPLESSAWIEAVESGLAQMVGQDPARLAAALRDFTPRAPVEGFVEHLFGAGDAGRRIVAEVARELAAPGRRAEGPWHPIARFAQLPPAVDAMNRTFDAFAAQVAEAAARHGAVTLDLSRSLDNATELVALAAAAQVPVRLALPLDRLSYNLFAPAIGAQLRAMVAQGGGLAIGGADLDTVALWGAPAEPLVDFTIDLDDLIGAGQVCPWLWNTHPLSPFERRLRLIDTVREAELAALREAALGTTSGQ